MRVTGELFRNRTRFLGLLSFRAIESISLKPFFFSFFVLYYKKEKSTIVNYNMVVI
jgi:hypothetical protein